MTRQIIDRPVLFTEAQVRAWIDELLVMRAMPSADVAAIDYELRFARGLLPGGGTRLE